MVHAPLRKIGLARTDIGEGGADLILDALDAAVPTRTEWTPPVTPRLDAGVHPSFPQAE
jgi:hypothetical protein